jgi:hypothetical protein
MFCGGRIGNRKGMQPQTSTEPLPIHQVHAGMSVVDGTGEGVGVVAAVQLPATDVRPDVAAGIAEHLMAGGYIRIDGTGFLSNDVYAGGDEIAGVAESGPGVVSLRVHRDELPRADA